MGSIFSKPKAPPPDPQIAKSQKKQEEVIETQEVRAEQEQKTELKKTQAVAKARRQGRRGGGASMRLLLSPDRENAQLGLKNTLG